MDNKKKAEIAYLLYQRSDTQARRFHQKNVSQARDFFFNVQLSKDEQEMLSGSGMPDFIINRITAIIEMMMYFIIGGNPKWEAKGLDGSDTDFAEAISALLQHGYNISNGRQKLASCVRDCLVESLGGLVVTVDPDKDFGRGEVVIDYIQQKDIFIDPSSTDLFFQDAGYIIIRKLISKTKLKRMLPEYESQIDKVTGSAFFSGGNYSERSNEGGETLYPEEIVENVDPKTAEYENDVEFLETYRKVKKRYVRAFIVKKPSDEELKQITEGIEVAVKEMEIEAAVKIQEMQKEMGEAVQAGKMIPARMQLEIQKAQKQFKENIAKFRDRQYSDLRSEATKVVEQDLSIAEFKKLNKNDETFRKYLAGHKEYYKTFINKQCTVGSDVFIYEEEFEMEDYPVLLLPAIWANTPYPLSFVQLMIGKQREINKSHQIMIHHANLISNPQIWYQEGQIDPEEWEQDSSAPGALLKWNNTGDGTTPVEKPPQQLNSAFYTITQEGKSDLEYLGGISVSSMGMVTQGQQETYRGLVAQDEFSTRRIKQWVETVLEPFLSLLGRVQLRMGQLTYDTEKVFSIVQPQGTKDKRYKLNVPLYSNYGEVIGRINDIRQVGYNVAIVSGSTKPINRLAKEEHYFKYFQAGLLDDIAMTAETDISNKEALLRRKSIYSELSQKVEQMQNVLKDKEGTIETLERQLVQAGIKAKINEADKKIHKSVVNEEEQIRANKEIALNRMGEEVKRTKQNVDSYLGELKQKQSIDKNK